MVAVDPSKQFVATCRGRVPGAHLLPAQAESLPFGAACFNAVLSQLVVNFGGCVRGRSRLEAAGTNEALLDSWLGLRLWKLLSRLSAVT